VRYQCRGPRSRAGHRTLGILGKGNKPATIPLVPVRLARSTWQRERCEADPACRGQRLDRQRADVGAVHPHMLRAAFIAAALDAGVLLRDVQIAARHADPRSRSTTGVARTSIATRLRRRGVRVGDYLGSDRRRLYPLDRVHPVDGPVGNDLADPGALGAATRYASAKSMRSVSYTSMARSSSAGPRTRSSRMRQATAVLGRPRRESLRRTTPTRTPSRPPPGQRARASLRAEVGSRAAAKSAGSPSDDGRGRSCRRARLNGASPLDQTCTPDHLIPATLRFAAAHGSSRPERGSLVSGQDRPEPSTRKTTSSPP
jgi:hypothetical protein